MTTLDEFSIDSAGPFGGTDEAYYEDVDSESGFGQAGEDEDSESRRSQQENARRRARYRQRKELERLQAGRRQPARTAAPGQPTPVAAEVRRTQAALREVDLKNAVRADDVSSRMSAHARQARGTENALAAGVVIGAAQTLFGTSSLFNNQVVKLGLPLTSLAFLRRPKGDPMWKNPQVVVPVTVAGMFLGKELLGSFSNREVADVDIRQAPTQLAVGQRFVVKAVATDQRGDIIGDSLPTLTVNGASEEPVGSGIFKVAAGATEVSVIAVAGAKTAPLIIPVVSTGTK